MSQTYSDAELYDVIYSRLTEDVAFYVAEAVAVKGPVLEVGCGTGRVLLPTRAAGVEIDGLDVNADRLDALRDKARAQQLNVRVFHADMRDFTMPHRYAMVTMPFRVFQHNLTMDDQVRTLRTCREHLHKDGALVFNVFYPSFARLAEPDGVRQLEAEFSHPHTGTPLRLYGTRRANRVEQVMHVEFDLEEAGVTRASGYSFDLRWTFKPEMELLLRAAGFRRFDVFGGFDRRDLTHDTDEMVWFAWKD